MIPQPETVQTLITKWRNDPAADYGDDYTNGYMHALNKCAAELESVLSQLPQREWQPISTCPKDGTWVLGWNRDSGYFVWRDGPGLITGEDPEPTLWRAIPPVDTEPT